MTPDEPTWDSTEFDPEPGSGSGFLPSEPETRKRVESAPVTPPPVHERRRGGLFWFGVLASIVLLVAVIGGGIYWMSLPSAEEEAFFAKEATVPVVNDSLTIEPSTEDVEITDSSVIHDPEALEALFGHEDSLVQAPPAPVKSEPVRSIASTVTKKTLPLPPKAAVKTSAPTSKNAMFVVQVFSSPSRDDADEWLQSLRSKNVSDAYVTEQKIKGESWYRVRFGQFSSREEAESEALRLGFREPWVARIR